MRISALHHFVFRFLSVSIVSMGFMQVSGAGVIGTQQMIDSALRQEQLTRVEMLLARQDVADQLVQYGVAPEAVLDRVQNMTTAELAALEGRIDQQIAGAGALELIGAVFLVLLILELVGVTDIFKSV